jgi:hypothetical protein
MRGRNQRGPLSRLDQLGASLVQRISRYQLVEFQECDFQRLVALIVWTAAQARRDAGPRRWEGLRNGRTHGALAVVSAHPLGQRAALLTGERLRQGIFEYSALRRRATGSSWS